MVNYSRLADILENNKRYGLTYLALFSLIIVIFIFGKLESDKASKKSYIKYLAVVAVVYLCSIFTVASIIDTKVSKTFRSRAIHRLANMGIGVDSLEFNVEYLGNLIKREYIRVYGVEPSKYYVNSFIDKVLSNYYNNKNIRLPTWLEFAKVSLIRVGIGAIAGGAVYTFAKSLNVRNFNNLIPVYGIAVIVFIYILLNAIKLNYLKNYNYVEEFNKGLSEGEKIPYSIDELDKLVYVVWKDIKNRKDKNIKVFKRDEVGLEPDEELKFLANVALNRYFGKTSEFESEFTVEFNNWYRTLKLDLDKVFI